MNARAAALQLRQLAFRACGPAVRRWPPYSRLMTIGDRVGWVLDEEMRDLGAVCRRLGIRTASDGWAAVTRRQCVFYASQYVLLDPPAQREHRRCLAYFHGRPGTGVPEFDAVYENLRRTRETWVRIQVSHREMYDLVRAAGLDGGQVHRIPIAVRLEQFPLRTRDDRVNARRRMGLPHDAFVVGSFQKDGDGWGEGLTPKRIKGPDVLVNALRQLRETIPELFVLLCGPARGFVKRGLAEAGIRFSHRLARRYEDLAACYHALDAYLVASRQEGGPKAVLESMAAGVPLVSTRVGQAADLVQDGVNGLLRNVEDAEALAHAVTSIYEMGSDRREAMVSAGRRTAQAHSWESQTPLWKRFFEGVVE